MDRKYQIKQNLDQFRQQQRINKHLESAVRQDIILEILQTIVRVKKAGTVLQFIWVPAHTGVEGNALADRFANEATKKADVKVESNYSRRKRNGEKLATGMGLGK